MEEGPHELPMWIVAFTLEDVADYIPCKLENQSAYPCIEWVGRCLTEMETLGGKVILCSCHKVFFLHEIALKWVKQPRSIMQPPYIPYYHPSMVWVYHYMEYFESPNKKCPSYIHGRLKSSVHARRNLAQGEIQSLIDKNE